MDEIDRKILRLLQSDGSMPLHEIAKKVHLSKSPCWSRIRKMEIQGIITGRGAQIAPAKVGLRTMVFVALRADRGNQHNEEWVKAFTNAINELPEIMEVYRLAGQIDYLVKVIVEDMEAYDKFYRRLVKKIALFDVHSMVVMAPMKVTTKLPI